MKAMPSPQERRALPTVSRKLGKRTPIDARASEATIPSPRIASTATSALTFSEDAFTETRAVPRVTSAQSPSEIRLADSRSRSFTPTSAARGPAATASSAATSAARALGLTTTGSPA